MPAASCFRYEQRRRLELQQANKKSSSRIDFLSAAGFYSRHL
jgi:hypothetical protein